MVISNYFVKKIINPKRVSLEKTISLSKKHHLYYDFDSVNKKKIKIKSFDSYILNGYFIENESKTNKYVIISHGHNWTKVGSLKFMNLYLSLGFNCIIYDNRGHGENEKSTITLGLTESKDLIEIIYFVRKKYGSNIFLGLHGESMGASLSLMSLKYKPDVQFVVSDCGYANFSSVVSLNLKHHHIPKIFLKLIGWLSFLRYGFNLTKVSVIPSLKDNKIPICYIHGKKDTYVPYNESVIMYDKTNSYRELHLFSNSEHLRCYLDEAEKYKKIIEKFLRKVSFIK